MKKIAQITDLHIDDYLAQGTGIDARRNFEDALQLARSRDVTSVVLTGDLGAPAALPWIFAAVKDCGFGLQVILGNHDQAADFRQFEFLEPLFKEGGLYYAQELDGLEMDCLYLDSSSAHIGQAQLDWLSKQLARSSAPALVFSHHPILDCGNTIADRRFPLWNRAAVEEVLHASAREITVFCGHYHFRSPLEARAGRVRQLLTPASLGQIKPDREEIEPDPGYVAYRELWLADGTLQTEVVEVK